jgi:S1-C subfamily serine protease
MMDVEKGNPRRRIVLRLSIMALAAAAAIVAALPANAGLPDIIDRVKPSVVAVGTHQRTRGPQFAFRGTGFVVGDGTMVATNAHVVPELLDPESREAIAIAIPSGGGREPQMREATLLATDRDHDLALLRIGGAPLPALKLGDSEAVREGEMVLFTGFPIGAVLGLSPVTHQALVSAITPIAIPSANAQQLDPRVIRRIQSGTFTVFQLDATAYPGNSGSPLYDADSGEVRGIINMVFVKGTKESALSQPTGISFAIPVEHLDKLIGQGVRQSRK